MDQMEFCYRVREHDDGTWTVHVMFPPPHIGTSGWAKDYHTYDALPELIKEKIAVLQLVNDDETAVPGIGRRHASVPPTYWVYCEQDVYANAR